MASFVAGSEMTFEVYLQNLEDKITAEMAKVTATKNIWLELLLI